jgi:hypothetical protein
VTTTLCVPRGYAAANPLHLSADVSAPAADPYLGNNTAAANVLLYTDVLFRDGFDPAACP